MKFGPVSARDRPVVFLARLETVCMADQESYFWRVGPGVGVVFQVAGEKGLLNADAVIGVELGPVLEPMDLEELVGRGGLLETLEITARVQALAAPIGR